MPASRATGFDAYVGIDWSGAKGRGYRGIAVALCTAGSAAPQLVPAAAQRWTRSAVYRWLAAKPQGQRWMVGIDMAFALPAPFPPPPRLWSLVEAHCAQDEDLAGGRYADDDARFWLRGKRAPQWVEHRRPVERACALAGLGHPETPLKLIGPKQVGRGTLAGARLLHRLHVQHAGDWSIWPFDGPPDPARSVCVEIYPRLFIRRAAAGAAKLRAAADLDRVLQACGSRASGLQQFDDHQADALVSAAGLRQLAADPALWQAGLGQAQGWIFGVPRV